MSTHWTILIAAFLLSQNRAGFGDSPRVEIKVGDHAPLFKATDDQQKPWDLSEHLGERLIVLYFYPADFTSGCERQADAWRDNEELLSNLGVEIVGISADSVESHQLFKKVRRLGFTLLSDESAAIAKLYGVSIRRGGSTQARDRDGVRLLDEHGQRKVVIRAATCCRSTFVIDRNGKIVYAKTNVKANNDNKDVLAFLRTISSEEN